ncbi:hypothetical protein [Rhodococcus phenolicus]|uniref:hypothetical protein n=1 Tax=Rhodococcus phenolicus TaxID=263849 RepID=UPI000B3158AB|nr:hypothetical protein [Rhodococcus phenolicus]
MTFVTAAAAESVPDRILGVVALAAMIALLVLLIVAAVDHTRRPRILKALGYGLAGVAGAFAIARGVAEFFVVDFGDPASYRDDWGGPTLLGVLLVHSGPGVVAVITAGYLIRRNRTAHSAVTG